MACPKDFVEHAPRRLWTAHSGGTGARAHSYTQMITGKVLQGEFIGDYTAAAMGWDGVLHPCWTDLRGKPGVTSPNQDSYTQVVRLDDFAE